MRRSLCGILGAIAMLVAGQTVAAADHAQLVRGLFQTAPDVTRAGLQVYAQQAGDFMKTVHWTWDARSDAMAWTTPFKQMRGR